MVLCHVIRVSSTVGVNVLTKFTKINPHTKYLSCIRQFSASQALFTGNGHIFQWELTVTFPAVHYSN